MSWTYHRRLHVVKPLRVAPLAVGSVVAGVVRLSVGNNRDDIRRKLERGGAAGMATIKLFNCKRPEQVSGYVIWSVFQMHEWMA